jgi:hypothetical protein
VWKCVSGKVTGLKGERALQVAAGNKTGRFQIKLNETNQETKKVGKTFVGIKNSTNFAAHLEECTMRK